MRILFPCREAVQELQGRKIRGEGVILELLEKYEANSVGFPKYKLKVENLSQNTSSKVSLTVTRLVMFFSSSQELHDIMKEAGEVVMCEAHNERKGEGVVEYSRWRHLVWALKNLHLTKISGRTISLTEMKD